MALDASTLGLTAVSIDTSTTQGTQSSAYFWCASVKPLVYTERRRSHAVSHHVTAPRRVPRLLSLPPGKSLQSFPLGPVDGFILSRIDGSSADSEIVAVTGLDASMVQASLEKLVSLGIISYGDPPQTTPQILPPPSAPRVTGETIPPRPVQDNPSPQRLDSRSEAPSAPRGLYDPAELDEDVDIDKDHRRKILDLFYVLDELDHYALLGLPRTADKKTVKRAYYEAASLFHPDKFFRKRLGAFKNKMEAVFSRVTLAHDTLTNSEVRQEYDAYLGDQQAAAAIEADLFAPVAPLEPVPTTSAPPPPPKVTASESPELMHANAAPRQSEQARREALARRLMGGSVAPPRQPSVPQMRAVTSDPAALRRHYKTRVDAARERMVKEYVEQATAAMEKSDWGMALTSFKLAMAAAPDDTELRASLVEAQAKATRQLAENYQRQAQYEEKGQRWAEAARSWTRVTKARPDSVEAHERAAHCLVGAQGNLHEAATLARRAITLDPSKTSYRVTLAKVYIAAGLGLNAKRELEAALQMAPGDASIQTLLKRIRA